MTKHIDEFLAILNIIFMKFLNYLGFGLTLGFMGLASCTPMDDCKTCEAVTYDVNDGHEISRESAIEYCGPALDEKENADPIISGDERVVWECK